MKKMIKKGTIFAIVLMMSCGGYVKSAEASIIDSYSNWSIVAGDGADTRSATTVWYYKVENGKKYRRLYDATNGKWLTDWILC